MNRILRNIAAPLYLSAVFLLPANAYGQQEETDDNIVHSYTMGDVKRSLGVLKKAINNLGPVRKPENLAEAIETCKDLTGIKPYIFHLHENSARLENRQTIDGMVYLRGLFTICRSDYYRLREAGYKAHDFVSSSDLD